MTGDPRTHGLWQLTAPPPPETAPLAGEARADVAVVGAGFTGLSAALHLAEGGADVVVLEAAEIGHGGSGRNVGLVNAGLWLMPDDVASVLGEAKGEQLLAFLGHAPQVVFELVERHGIACEAHRNGTLHCAVGPAGRREVEQRAAQWRRRGAPVRLLEADETASRTGSPRYAGALLDERAGTVQPLAYVRGLARAALAAGARLHTRTPLAAARRDGAGWRLDAGEGRVRAEWVVVATNAYGEGEVFAAPRTELVALPYFQFATAPLGHNVLATILPGLEGAWDTREVLSSFRRDDAGRLLIGSVGALRGSGGRVHQAWARRAVRRLFPQVGEVAFEAGWWGRIGMTTDSVPRFHVLAPQVIGFSGYNGRGIAPGTVFGRLLADHILGRLAAADMPLPVSPIRPRGLRAALGACYEAGSQAIHALEHRLGQ